MPCSATSSIIANIAEFVSAILLRTVNIDSAIFLVVLAAIICCLLLIAAAVLFVVVVASALFLFAALILKTFVIVGAVMFAN